VIEPTPTQFRVLRFIADYIEANGWPPSFREITDHLGTVSPNGAGDHLKALERKGYIVRAPRQSRAIRITPDGRQLLEASP